MPPMWGGCLDHHRGDDRADDDEAQEQDRQRDDQQRHRVDALELMAEVGIARCVSCIHLSERYALSSATLSSV
jgi:hypothetical protein